MKKKLKKVKKIFKHTNIDIRLDILTRQLYSTDASIYEITPLGVAFPKNKEELSLIIEKCYQNSIPIIPRGSGTGLVGGAIGEGIIIDFKKYFNKIYNLDIENKTIWVQSGVVLDSLNNYLKKYNLQFGPDVATSSRATLGGMISNNSSGAHSLIYGTTSQNLLEIEGILPGGEEIKLNSTPFKNFKDLENIILKYKDKIKKEFSYKHFKRWAGYNLLEYIETKNLAKLIAGSEGTLLNIVSAKLKLVSLPTEKGLVIIKFKDIPSAMEIVPDIMKLKPSAVEHIDKPLFEHTKGKIIFKKVREMLKLDEEECESILLIEFYDNVEEKFKELKELNFKKPLFFKKEEEMNLIWDMRKSGLSLVTATPNRNKPVPGIEDIVIPLEKLPNYVKDLIEIFKEYKTYGSFYGHAGAGLLHIRPTLNLHLKEDREKLKNIADEVSKLVKKYKGIISGEHGLGIARTSYLKEHLDKDILNLHLEIKNYFDHKNIMNPGKIISNNKEPYIIHQYLRIKDNYKLELNFEPVLAYSFRDKSFINNLEQCNGCGACLKEEPTMCPTYRATKEEIMSPRGRANIIRAFFEGKLDKNKNLNSKYLNKILSTCLSCKSCQRECASNVDISLLKADILYAKNKKIGTKLRDWIISSLDNFAKIGCAFPLFFNFFQNNFIGKFIIEKTLGISSKRKLLQFTYQRFDIWFHEREKNLNSGKDKKKRSKEVILWDDTFTRYYQSNVGKACVKILEKFGYKVKLLKNRKCCGRTAFSVGRLDKAKKLGEFNVNLIKEFTNNEPIIFIEPSCFSMFYKDYRELKIPYAEEISKRVFLFEDFISNVLLENKDELSKIFNSDEKIIGIHTHCHSNSIIDKEKIKKSLELIPNIIIYDIPPECCGMAGLFGMLKENYELSIKIGEKLKEVILTFPKNTYILSSGISCRQQLSTLVPSYNILHLAQFLEKIMI